MKAKTLLVRRDSKLVSNEGDSVLAIQGTKKDGKIMVNMDWFFDPSWDKSEIKSMLGGFLGNIENVFGEKMVTEMISHWGNETGKLVKTGEGQAIIYSKSRN